MSLPPVSELVPHAGPMRLLERVVSHDDAATVCETRPEASALFAGADGSVPGFVAIEYMAQCIAVHAGLAARVRGEPLRPGLFLGSRRVTLRADRLAPGRTLRVTARPLRSGSSGAAAFACTVEDPAGGAPLVEGTLTALVLREGRLPAPRRGAGAP